MGQEGSETEDTQRLAPAAWCAHCGRELYGGEEAWWLDGRAVHEDCLGEYARAVCPHGTLHNKENGNRRYFA